MDKIIWQLGADSSQVRAEMANAVKHGQQGGEQLRQSWDKVEGSHEKLLRSSHRVSKQIVNVSQDFLRGASAGDILAGSLEGIARSLNISLGALAGLGVGAVIIQKITAVREEYEKLFKSIEKIHASASQSGDIQTMSALEQTAKRSEEAIKKVNDSLDARWGNKGFWSRVGQTFTDIARHPLDLVTRGNTSEKEDADAAEQTRQDLLKTQADILGKRGQQSGLKESELAGTPKYQIDAAQVLITAKEKVAKSLEELNQNIRETSIALQQILKLRNDKAMERSGRSLKETADSLPDVVNNSVSWEKYQASQQAKKALALKGQAEGERMEGNPDAAHNLFNQSGEAAEGITGLKPSEKMSADLKGALAVTEGYLQKIAESKIVLVNQ